MIPSTRHMSYTHTHKIQVHTYGDISSHMMILHALGDQGTYTEGLFHGQDVPNHSSEISRLCLCMPKAEKQMK